MLNEEDKAELLRLNNEALDVMMDLGDMLPQTYRLTLVARHIDGVDGADIILTNDTFAEAIEALRKNESHMENA